MDKKLLLKHYFGYDNFLVGQEELIDGVLSGRDVIGIMPTGAGKSLCYQLPALLLDGITLVISPLISLMKDQVGALVENGVSVAFINSSLTYEQTKKVLEYARSGKYKLIYVAPERLDSPAFLTFAENANISMIAVDEAHCVSQWGQNFRPSYLKITDFIDKLPKRPIVSAFTATATKVVKSDIVNILRQENPLAITTGFDRENLYFEVKKPKDKFTTLIKYLKKNKNANGIVYCSTRKAVEQVCADLVSKEFLATRYHAGLDESERKENQDDFLFDRKTIMVATNAFGMGIDKSNVSFVIHFNMPKDIESYYQEAGRAGRDGTKADCILLYSGKDVVTNNFLISKNNRNDEIDEKQKRLVIENDQRRLNKMTFYCYTSDCLRKYILKYFGDIAKEYCGNCSNCMQNFEHMDITTSAQKILSCVYKTGQMYGSTTIIAVLRGSKAQKILEWGLNRISTYGIMKDEMATKIRSIINFLILGGYLKMTDSQFPVLKFGSKTKNVLIGGEKLFMKFVKEVDENERKFSSKHKSKHGRVREIYNIEGIDNELFDMLREIRFKIAQEKEVPAFIVFSNTTLIDMCKKLPTKNQEFLKVTGVGNFKVEEYGKQFILAIKEYKNKGD